jgi:hypothetical protein
MVVMLIKNSVVARQPSNECSIHITNMFQELELWTNVLESLFHNTWIRIGKHSILERGHINISTSKQLICPPTGIIEGPLCRALLQALRTSSYQGISVKRQHRHITLKSYLSVCLVGNNSRNTINGFAGRSHIDKKRRRSVDWGRGVVREKIGGEKSKTGREISSFIL